MNEILVDVALEETRVALVEDGELVEFYIERPGTERLVGNIYRGKVSSVLPGMQAAFIDIGYEKNAFLFVDDVISAEDGEEFNGIKIKECSIENVLKPGQEITVQVIKEPIGTKGPRVTTQITLPGRHLVLLPNADYIGISRRISNEQERQRLKKFAEQVKPKNMGLIVRTASEGKSLEDFENDISFLLKHWKKIKRKEKKGNVPRCIHRDLSLIYRTVRDLFTSDIDRFVINDRKEYQNVLELTDMISPMLKNRVSLYTRDYDLFDFYGLEPQISKALSRKVWLKCGAYIVIDRTEALTVIDVNTGKYVGKDNLEKTIVKTNIDAAREIAKQIRLRDISGIIIIDFIDMDDPQHQKEVLEALKLALKKDRTKTTVVGMTGLGLLEMTRKKVRQGLSAFMMSDCPYCEGTGKVIAPESIALKIEKKIAYYANNTDCSKMEIEVHPSIIPILKGVNNRNLRQIQKLCNKKITLVPNEKLDREEISINCGGISKSVLVDSV